MYTNYSDFTHAQYDEMIDIICTGNNSERRLGSLKIGRTCIDIIAEASYGNRGNISLDVFVGGVSTEYATTLNNEPYDYVDRLRVFSEDNLEAIATYEYCIAEILRILQEYSSSSGYKAENLGLWHYIDTDDTFNWD